MSEPKLISPMLDNFEMGGIISSHDGVQCCPAMRIHSDDKYIVKIISVPASETKLDALLLTGAYSDKSAALAYYEQLANGIADEKRILDTLSKLDGFVPFEDCQIVPMDNGSGYDVYLLGEYRKTLERQIARTQLTHLNAINLGIDLCAALSACRRNGYLYVNLKPSNIYVTGDKEYKIGDLGFVRLNSLKYETLPDMYRSSYTAPEVEDAFAVLNDTMDIYSAGIILYEIYNGGKLPVSGEPLTAPEYADDEMAAIILKACDAEPANRWSDPVQMGQAIVNYMQKNGAEDTPIVTVPLEIPEVENEIHEEVTASENYNEEVTNDAETLQPQEKLDDDADSDEDSNEDTSLPDYEKYSAFASISSFDSDMLDNDLVESDEEDEDEDIDVAPESQNEEPVSLVEEISAAVASEIILDDLASEMDNDKDEVTEQTVVTEQTGTEQEEVADQSETIAFSAYSSEATDVEYDNLSFLDELDKEAEQLLADMGDDLEGVSVEFSEMLDHIDELTSHQIPDPVVAPEAIEIQIPDPVTADTVSDELSAIDETAVESTPDEKADDAVVESDNTASEELPYVPKKRRPGLVIAIVLAIITALAAGAYFFYTLYYLQPIHTLDLNGSEDTLQVSLSADIDESLLTIICADPHGNQIPSPVVGGRAVFSGLTPDTAYTVSVEVDGFHKLTGTTTKVYSTPIQSKVSQLNTITGAENGSVILSFAVDGPDSEQWNVIYNADGEAERVTAFPSHMVTLTGLTVGKEYTFRLEPIEDIYISGETEIKYVAQNLVCAENLHVTSCVNNVLTAEWSSPEGAEVAEWTVRCYNESGYDETLTTTQTNITFENVDDSIPNTVEVTAAQMSVCQRVVVGANAVTVSDFTVSETSGGSLILSWQANREIPKDGWTVRYAVNDVAATTTIITKDNSAQVPVVPNGNYSFTILDGDGNSVLGGPFTYAHGSVSTFNAYGVDKSNLTLRLCKTPTASSWSYTDLTDEDYVNAFSVGQKISMVLALDGKLEETNDSVLVTFVIYDDSNNLVNFSSLPLSWQSMWYQNYCELDLPLLPSEIGTYKVALYFNGLEVGSQKFEVTN